MSLFLLGQSLTNLFQTLQTRLSHAEHLISIDSVTVMDNRSWIICTFYIKVVQRCYKVYEPCQLCQIDMVVSPLHLSFHHNIELLHMIQTFSLTNIQLVQIRSTSFSASDSLAQCNVFVLIYDNKMILFSFSQFLSTVASAQAPHEVL